MSDTSVIRRPWLLTGGAGRVPPGSTLGLNFMTGTLDPSLTFTRASTATYFDATGTMQTTATNLALWSADFTNAAWSKLQATITPNAVLAPDGTMTASKLVETAVSNTHYMVEARIGSNETLTLSCYLRAGERTSCSLQFTNQATASMRAFFDLTAGTAFAIDGPNADYTAPSSTIQRVGSAGWFRCTLTATKAAVNTTNAPAVALYNASSTYLGDGTSGIYVWGVQLEVGTTASAYVPTTSVANGAPRFDYDPVTHAPRGLLIEESRTNVAFPSVVDNVVWTAQNTVLTPGSGVAPDGTNMATLFVDNATSATHTSQLGTTFAFVSGITYTFSIYAKQGTARGLQILTGSAPFSALPYANFDLAAGTTGSVANGTASITSVGNGWYRCVFATAATASASTIALYVALTNNNNVSARGPIYVGTGTGVYLWGAQTEAGAFPTSYIPTTAAAVTRSIDLCAIPPANMGFFTAPGGSWMAEFIFFNSAPPNSRIIARTETVGGASVYALGAARVGFQIDGVGLATANAGTANAVTKGASTWTAGQAKVCLNGGAVASLATLVTGYGIYTTTGVRFMMPIAAGSTDNTSGYIRRVRYWPRTLSNAELQSVTT